MRVRSQAGALQAPGNGKGCAALRRPQRPWQAPTDSHRVTVWGVVGRVEGEGVINTGCLGNTRARVHTYTLKHELGGLCTRASVQNCACASVERKQNVTDR